MEPDTKDSQEISILKERFLKYLDEKFSITEHHYLATFLSPEFRSTPKKVNNIKLIKDSMKLLNGYMAEVYESDVEDEITPLSENIPEQKNKLFDSFREKAVETQVNITNEVYNYEHCSLSKDDIDCNPIIFWINKRTMYPKLSRIALWILSCPATSTSSERVFSKLGLIITPLRNNLDPDTVDKLSFISSNGDQL